MVRRFLKSEPITGGVACPMTSTRDLVDLGITLSANPLANFCLPIFHALLALGQLPLFLGLAEEVLAQLPIRFP